MAALHRGDSVHPATVKVVEGIIQKGYEVVSTRNKEAAEFFMTADALYQAAWRERNQKPEKEDSDDNDSPEAVREYRLRA